MILVVDDNPADLELITRALTRAGFDVQTARNGVEAIALMERETPACVVTDWHMPVQSRPNGRDLVLTLRQHPVWHDIPIIVLSGVEDRERIWTQTIPLRIDHYLTKDDLDLLVLQVRRLVETR